MIIKNKTKQLEELLFFLIRLKIIILMGCGNKVLKKQILDLQ